MNKYQYFKEKLTQALMAMAALFFFQDVIVDMREHFTSEVTYSVSELIHLLFEMAAVVALSVGFFDSIRHTQALRDQNAKQSKNLFHLTRDFDALVKEKFAVWGLTPAERDVALLLLRGLQTDQIAKLRKVSTGTIKAQSHHLMQKAGVTSRVELMSLFLDEFLDISLETSISDQVSATK